MDGAKINSKKTMLPSSFYDDLDAIDLEKIGEDEYVIHGITSIRRGRGYVVAPVGLRAS